MAFYIKRLNVNVGKKNSLSMGLRIGIYILFAIVFNILPSNVHCSQNNEQTNRNDFISIQTTIKKLTSDPLSQSAIECDCVGKSIDNLLYDDDTECNRFCRALSLANSTESTVTTLYIDGMHKRDLTEIDKRYSMAADELSGDSMSLIADISNGIGSGISSSSISGIGGNTTSNEYFIDHDGGYLGGGGNTKNNDDIGGSGGTNTAESIDANIDTGTIETYDPYFNCTEEFCPNITCVGEPIYCNYTYDEYVQMLYDYIYPTVPEWILIISHTVVFFMGLVGNALVCIAVYTNYTMRTVTNIFIVNLAVADFFVILFCLPPTVVWDVTETWFMGETMCKVVLYFQTVSVTVSVLTLTFISLDRWYAICFPLRYVSTNGRAIGSIAFIWTLAVVSDIPEFLYSTTKNKELRFDIKLFTQCIATWDKDTEKNIYIGRFLALYVGPLFLMTVAYFQIVRVLWKSDTIPGHRESRNQTYTCGYLRSGPAANSSTMGQLRARRKAAKMLVAVVVMFAMCYFPVHFLNILRYTIDIGQSEVIAVLSLFSHWLCYANSAINPVIYNFMSGKFRREFRSALDKCRCGRIRVEDRSLYHSTPASRVNNISPSSRSNYQLTSVRDITSLRDRHTVQTSFVENGGGNGHNNNHNAHNQTQHHHHNQLHIHHPTSLNHHQLAIDNNRLQPKFDPGP